MTIRIKIERVPSTFEAEQRLNIRNDDIDIYLA